MDKKSRRKPLTREEFLELIRRQEAVGELSEFDRKALLGARQFDDPNRLEGMLDRLEGRLEERTASRPRRFLNLKQMASIAASLLVIILAGSWWMGRHHRMAMRSFEPLPAAIAQADIQRSTLNSRDVIQKALMNYEQGDFKKAIPLFEQALHSNNQDSSILQLYYGISLLGRGEAEEAVIPLEKARDNREDNLGLQRAGNWYLALAHLAMGDRSTCREILETLTSEQGDFRREAIKLKKELGDGE